jgi:hypothetical protein
MYCRSSTSFEPFFGTSSRLEHEAVKLVILMISRAVSASALSFLCLRNSLVKMTLEMHCTKSAADYKVKRNRKAQRILTTGSSSGVVGNTTLQVISNDHFTTDQFPSALVSCYQSHIKLRHIRNLLEDGAPPV